MTKRSLAVLLLALTFAAPSALAQAPAPGPADFAAYRAKLEALIPDGVAILEGRDFGWLTGVFDTEARLILIPPGVAERSGAPERWRTTLYLAPKSPQSGVWSDPRLSYGDDVLKVTGIAASAPMSAFSADVAKLGLITDTVYVAGGRGAGRPPGPQAAAEGLWETVVKLLPGIKVRNLAPLLGEIRWSKDPHEIEIMRRSCGITVEAFKEAARVTKPGAYEYDLQAVVDYVFESRDAKAEFIIIGSGPNSCILHHADNDRRMEAGDVVVVDIGNVYHTMGTDLTRTIPASGSFTPEQKKIYAIVLEAQKKAIGIVKPGVTLAEVHKTAFDVIDKAGYGKYFIHGSSHSLNGGSAVPFVPARLEGLFTPPAAKGAYAGLDNPVREGTMFTIEPGIYIPEKSLGVRIEDSVLVTADGCEVLTRQAPKEIVDVEKLMKEKPVLIKEAGK